MLDSQNVLKSNPAQQAQEQGVLTTEITRPLFTMILCVKRGDDTQPGEQPAPIAVREA